MRSRAWSQAENRWGAEAMECAQHKHLKGKLTMATAATAVSDPAASLRTNMRKLWADHVFWTRQYIVSFASDLGDVGAAAGRLLKNQEHIGNAIVPFYGQQAGTALTDLLKQHIMIAVDLLNAAKAGDDPKFQQEDAKWTSNANEIAGLLSSANPNWPKRDVVDLLALHLKLTKDEAVARLTGKWDDDVTAFDDIFTEINTVADTLSNGIIKQFPDKFPNGAARKSGFFGRMFGGGR